MKKAKKVAFSGVFTALCTVLMLIGSLFQSLDLSAAAFGSIVVLIAVIELGKGWALGVYIASSLLSLILLPNKSAAVIFALFTGFYPIIKVFLNKIKPIFLSYIIRVVFCNLALSLLIFLSVKVFGLTEDLIGFNFLIYFVANVTFIVYDFALERIAVTYVSRLKRLIFRKR